MLVQLVCNPNKIDLTDLPSTTPITILVPDLESYHNAREQLFLSNREAEVVCIPPPSQYKPNMGKVPYAYIHSDYVANCEGNEPELKYYFTKK